MMACAFCCTMSCSTSCALFAPSELSSRRRRSTFIFCLPTWRPPASLTSLTASSVAALNAPPIFDSFPVSGKTAPMRMSSAKSELATNTTRPNVRNARMESSFGAQYSPDCQEASFMKKLIIALLVFSAMPLLAEDVVRLGNLKFAHYGAVWYMKEIAPKYGLKIEEKIFAKGLDIIPGILSGDIDAAASALDAAIAGRAAGAPVFVVAGFAKGGVRIVGRSDLNLKRVADLKGKKVGVARGGAQELCLLAELAKAHLTWSDKGDKDVHLIYLAYADLNGALLGKNIDAMCQSEPQ